MAMALPVDELSDAAFIDRMAAAYEQNPLFRHKPENIARLYRIAGMHDTARQFETFIERITLPTIPWLCQQARAVLTGIDPRSFEAVMAERGLILTYLRSFRESFDPTEERYRAWFTEAIETIEKGEHRSCVEKPEPGKLIEERDV
jgi:hypothetical protein